MPATKRLDILRPMADLSEKDRRALFVESAMKKERSNAMYLAGPALDASWRGSN